MCVGRVGGGVILACVTKYIAPIITSRSNGYDLNVCAIKQCESRHNRYLACSHKLNGANLYEPHKVHI